MKEPLRSIRAPVPPKISPEAPLREAVAQLIDSSGAVLVVYIDALVGIFSERDLLLKVGDRYSELADRPIRDFMTPAPETLRGDDPIAFALNRMDVGHFRQIPIEEGDVPVGMVSIRNILQHLATQYPDLLTEV
ncbi:MAG TPA: CBS domain-containing protein [Rhodothermales bacterium]